MPDNSSTPSLSRHEPAGQVRGVVLFLHGGPPHGHAPVGRSASWRRMALLRRNIEVPLAQNGCACWLLRYGQQGWNDPAHPSPVPDVRWALAQASQAHRGVPVVLLGHSMGARAALYAADHPSVVGAVSLAGWFERSDPVTQLRGRRLRSCHGRRDRITSFVNDRDLVERARALGVDAEFINLGFLGHYMLTHLRRWHEFALQATVELLDLASPKVSPRA